MAELSIVSGFLLVFGLWLGGHWLGRVLMLLAITPTTVTTFVTVMPISDFLKWFLAGFIVIGCWFAAAIPQMFWRSRPT